jgi:hypothetical protein
VVEIPMSIKLSGILAAASVVASCASPGNDSRAVSPNISIAWDAGEAVRHVFTEGCLKAVAANRPIKETLDRGVALSRIRPLDVSPLKGDAPGTPAYAVISGASVVMTGTGERCSVASSSGDGPKLRTMLLEILDVQQTGWQVISHTVSDPAFVEDVRCRPVVGGVIAVQIVTAPVTPRPLQVIVFRSQDTTCPTS